MRIISGRFKGKKLVQPIDRNTRPLKDMTKESIFNLFLHSKKLSIKFEKSKVLDLFSGSGSFGIECISRYAKEVTFVEDYSPAVKILKKNLQSLKLNSGYKIIEKNIFDLNECSGLERNYDLIFADPPYKEEKIDELLSIIKNLNFLKKTGLFVLHRNKLDKDILTKNFSKVEERIYGISKIIFLKSK
tara:strand:- start:709 stop:1272 length:564 start_codon:yes stop_codon:yes gene_type:complete